MEESEELFLCKPMLFGTKASPNKGPTSHKVLAMLGKDPERQGASQKSHGLRMMQRVSLPGWTRGDQQGFVVWVELSRQESGWP